jgi:hypothetical protein
VHKKCGVSPKKSPHSLHRSYKLECETTAMQVCPGLVSSGLDCSVLSNEELQDLMGDCELAIKCLLDIETNDEMCNCVFDYDDC